MDCSSFFPVLSLPPSPFVSFCTLWAFRSLSPLPPRSKRVSFPSRVSSRLKLPVFRSVSVPLSLSFKACVFIERTFLSTIWVGRKPKTEKGIGLESGRMRYAQVSLDRVSRRYLLLEPHVRESKRDRTGREVADARDSNAQTSRLSCHQTPCPTSSPIHSRGRSSSAQEVSRSRVLLHGGRGMGRRRRLC